MILNEGIQVREVRFCFLCKVEGVPLYEKMRDRLFGAPGEWNLLRCPHCGLVWLNPRPITEDIGKVYTNYFTHVSNNPNPQKPRLDSVRKKVKRILLATAFGYNNLANGRSAQWFGRILNFISPLREGAGLSVMNLLATPKGKLLDVGCGSGGFLAWMRDLGWEVMGVEIDQEAVKEAQKQFGIDVYRGTLEEAGFREESFNAVTLKHVIEHLPDPFITLSESWRVLKKGGQVTVVTPNIESLGHRLFGKAWLPLDPPRHLHLFSPRTLRNCTERAGLSGLKLWTTTRSARWIWGTCRLIRRMGEFPYNSYPKIGLQLWIEGLTFQALEHMQCKVKEVGEEIVMVAIKKGR